ncbi:MAG: bifunctional DNA-formamidopyrimidine glycosylase/DNA-(apurinic or apyrimidinic site) lyase [Gammaproteobacteria bacterium]|nr:bifunctional DNA-formamidopyrimidine glycosylase/DNA-(apurinic or apyrimidinic site) lyase [Gammaproteobacteria bacterium]
MPELPEVETTRRGIASCITNRQITDVIVRQRNLRWPVPFRLRKTLAGQTISSIQRRGKYLLLSMQSGTLLIHLGMSGSLRVVPANLPAEKHDHVDIVFDNHSVLRLRDPRRFGAMLWTQQNPLQHKLLKDLGVEPLAKDFTAEYLFNAARKRKVAIKQFIMDSHIVVGVGNIYANEALFLAGIRPTIAAKNLSLPRMQQLVTAIKLVLKDAIRSGGTTLRDFTRGDGRPGYFRQQLNVYGREGDPCKRCGTPIKLIRQGQRASYYCHRCQR